MGPRACYELASSTPFQSTPPVVVADAAACMLSSCYWALEYLDKTKQVCIARRSWSKWPSLLKLHIYGFSPGMGEHSGRFFLDGRQLWRLLFVAEAEFDFHDVEGRSYGVGCKSTHYTTGHLALVGHSM